MNIKIFNVALGVALAATTLSASAQKKYTQGTLTINMDARGQTIVAKSYFTADSSATSFMAGPASIKILKDNKDSFFAVIVDVSSFNVKKAAVATPAEIEGLTAEYPKFTFAPTTETKQISTFNCKKVVATDAKGAKYDIWITNDFTVPAGVIPAYYASIGGVPIQYTSFAQGQQSTVMVTGIAEDKAPAGTYGIPAGFDKITLEELKALSGGGN